MYLHFGQVISMIKIFEESYNFYCFVYFIGRTNSMGNSKLK